MSLDCDADTLQLTGHIGQGLGHFQAALTTHGREKLSTLLLVIPQSMTIYYCLILLLCTAGFFWGLFLVSPLYFSALDTLLEVKFYIVRGYSERGVRKWYYLVVPAEFIGSEGCT